MSDSELDTEPLRRILDNAVNPTWGPSDPKFFLPTRYGYRPRKPRSRLRRLWARILRAAKLVAALLRGGQDH